MDSLDDHHTISEYSQCGYALHPTIINIQLHLKVENINGQLSLTFSFLQNHCIWPQTAREIVLQHQLYPETFFFPDSPGVWVATSTYHYKISSQEQYFAARNQYFNEFIWWDTSKIGIAWLELKLMLTSHSYLLILSSPWLDRAISILSTVTNIFFFRLY